VNKESSASRRRLHGDGKVDWRSTVRREELVVLRMRARGSSGFEADQLGRRRSKAPPRWPWRPESRGRDDLALLEANELILVYQTARAARRADAWPHTSSTPRMLRAVDLDGDGGNDLVISTR